MGETRMACSVMPAALEVLRANGKAQRNDAV